MGMFTKLKDKLNQGAVCNTDIVSASFVLGIQDIFALQNCDDVIVVGRLKGKVTVGDAVYISDMGDDDAQIFLTTILGIETGPGISAKEASDCHVGLKIEKGKLHHLKRGMVLHTRDQSIAEVHNAYINALGDAYVTQQNLELSNEDIAALSITDCAEIWRLFSWLHSQKEESEEQQQDNHKKIDKLAAALCQKILSANEIFYVYNKATGEPHLFSRTIKRDEGYECTPPDIRIFTKAYAEMMKSSFPEEKFEIRKIENGADKKGIYNFLGSVFYLNGACGVEVISEQTAIQANMLVPEPDYSNIRPQDIPVTNPDLVRWMLLIGQLGKPSNDDAEIVYKLYYRFMSIEAVKAKFLIPMQNNGDIPQPDEEGNTVLKKDTTLRFPTMDGKYGRAAVKMFTDWKRLRMCFDESWGGLVQPIEGMIGIYDCAINATQFSQAGSYIEQEMFEDMKQYTRRENE